MTFYNVGGVSKGMTITTSGDCIEAVRAHVFLSQSQVSSIK